jgi:hypothetical protein
MKSYILSESETRAEYKRRWKAMARAKKHGLDTDLIDALYGVLIKRGYERDIAISALYCAARDGLFGFANAWER